MKKVLLGLVCLVGLGFSSELDKDTDLLLKISQKCKSESSHPKSGNVSKCFNYIDMNEKLQSKYKNHPEYNNFIFNILKDDVVNIGYSRAFYICFHNGMDVPCLNTINTRLRPYGLNKGEISGVILGKKTYKNGKLIKKTN